MEKFILKTSNDILSMVVPPRAANAIDIKANQVLTMLRYEILIRDYRSIILFLTSGSGYNDIFKDILNGFILYFLWRDFDQFIASQHNPGMVLQPVFPQTDFGTQFLSGASNTAPSRGQESSGRSSGPSGSPSKPQSHSSMSLRDRLKAFRL